MQQGFAIPIVFAAMVVASGAQACDDRYPFTCEQPAPAIAAPRLVTHHAAVARVQSRAAIARRWWKIERQKAPPVSGLPGHTVTDARAPLRLPEPASPIQFDYEALVPIQVADNAALEPKIVQLAHYNKPVNPAPPAPVLALPRTQPRPLPQPQPTVLIAAVGAASGTAFLFSWGISFFGRRRDLPRAVARVDISSLGSWRNLHDHIVSAGRYFARNGRALAAAGSRKIAGYVRHGTDGPYVPAGDDGAERNRFFRELGRFDDTRPLGISFPRDSALAAWLRAFCAAEQRRNSQPRTAAHKGDGLASSRWRTRTAVG